MAVRQDAIRAYYNAALDEPDGPTNNSVWSSNQSITRPVLGPLAKFGLGASGIAAAGFLPFRGGNVWDKYVSGLRHFEEYFFGRIPRTLQLSNIFSQFESSATALRTITPEQLSTFSGGQLTYLEKLTGKDAHVMMREGLRFEGGKLSLAQSGETLLSNASIIRNVNKSHHFSSSYARSLGMQIMDDPFSEKLPFTNAKGEAAEEIFQVIGGNSRAQAIKRQLFGYGTEMVERANRLAKAPFDFPVIGPLLHKIAGKNAFGVRSGSGLQTLGRLAGKFGIVGGAAVLGYKTADWAVRNTALFDSTIFDQGITAGAATLWAQGNLAYAKFGDVTGWTDSAKKQEEYAPGSTSLLKLAAFPMMGAVGAAGLHYIQRAMLTARFQSKGRRIEQAADLAHRVLQRFEGSGIVTKLGRSFRESGSAIIRSLGKSPLTVMASVGAAIGTIPTLPFLFNALAPGQSEQELRDLYTGKTEIAVKRSRWWEMGRTPYEGTSIDYYRPHWYARMMQRGKDKSIWGDDDSSPLSKWYKSNFTYELEQKHFYDRPYPVTGRAFYDVPIIGPALSATLGRLIKPERYMHTDEFYNDGAYQHLAPGFGQDRALGLGEQLPGSPMSPHSLRGTIGEQAYRLTELSGLPGFLATSIKQSITGTQDLFDQQTQLQSADLINSAARDYWDLNLGGMAGCFVSNTLVKTPEGYKKISTLAKGDLVIGLDGSSALVLNRIDHDLNPEPIVRLKTKTNCSNVLVTKNHHLPAWKAPRYKGESKHMKPFDLESVVVKEYQVKELDKGDYLLYPLITGNKVPIIDLADSKQVVTERYVYYKCCKELATAFEALENDDNLTRSNLRLLGFPDAIAKDALALKNDNRTPFREHRFITVDEDLAYFIGWYIAEGCCDEGRITLTLNANEINIAERLSSIILSRLGKICTIVIKNNTLRLRFNFTAFGSWLKRYTGHGAHSKHIPYMLKTASPSIAAKTLQGVFEGDGWLNVEKQKGGFTTVSHNLIYDVFDLCLRFDAILNLNINYTEIVSGNYPQGTPKKDTKRHYASSGKRATYQLNNLFYGTDLIPIPNRQSFIKDGFLFISIRDIEETSIQAPVHDLTVEGLNHYVVEGIAVHNSNELFRRLLPHKRNQIETYNPIRNTMPEWLPGEGQRGPDLLHGDPYAKITEGEIRLPGEGYASRFKELEGLNPADYPLVHKYKILADVAPFTDQFADVEQQAAIAFQNKQFSKEEEAIYHQTQDQLRSKRNKRTFSDYKYRDKELDPVQQALADWNEKQKEDSGPSWFHRTLGSYWETLAHNSETPLEFLTPLSPAAKLIHMRTALEDYKQNQVYGTESAFWDRPWSNFLRPFLTSTANLVDEDTNIPSYVQDKRNLESYFDTLKYLKFTRLKNVANAARDAEAASEFEQKRRETLFGVNPYTFDYTEIFRALPRRDRDYFNAFVKTKDLDERAEILKLVPENEKGLYIAKWRQSDATDFARAVKLGVLSDAEIQKGEQQIQTMYDDMSSEGLPKDKNLFKEYISTRLQGESYADWYRRTKLLPQKVDDMGMNIPGPNWVGWHPAVDLDDIKLKVVHNLGESIQDFDLWPTREKALLYKQAFINEEAVAPVTVTNQSSDIRRLVQSVLTEFNIEDTHVDVTMLSGNNHKINMDIQEDRTAELKQRLRDWR